MQAKTKNILRTIAATVCLITYIFCYTLYEQTFIVWWLPLLIAAIPTLLTAPFAYKHWARCTGSGNRLPNILCHIYFAGAIFLFAFLGGNRYAADQDKIKEKTFSVTEKFCRERDKYVRAGRRRVRSGSYTVYYLRLKSDQGEQKTIFVSRALYNRTRAEGSVTLELTEGRFGFPFISPGRSAANE